MFTRTVTEVGFHLCIYVLFPSFFVDAETPVKVAVNGVVDKVDTDELEFCEEVTEVVNPIMIRFCSPERDYSLSKGGMTLEKGLRSQHSKDVQLHDSRGWPTSSKRTSYNF